MKFIKTLFTLLFVLLITHTGKAQQFTEQTGIILPNVTYSFATWADYDNDGYLDVLITGNDGTNPVTKIYKNNGDNTFTEQSGINLTGIQNSSVAWGDFDNDGDLDILMAGTDSKNTITEIWKNNGSNNFSKLDYLLLPGIQGTVKWADLDNDGDLDFIIAGIKENQEYITKIYWNENNIFTDANIDIKGALSADIADYNKDMYPDLVVSGRDINGNLHTTVYQNTGVPDFNFIERTDVPLQMLEFSSVSWGDYDNSGYPDILLIGSDNADKTNKTILYKNSGPPDFDFIEQTNTTLPQITSGTIEWGDYNADGNLDLILTGSDNSNNVITSVYQNTGAPDYFFVEQTDIVLQKILEGNIVWGDYDNDNKLDILTCGSGFTKIYKNTGSSINTKPDLPANIQIETTLTTVKLSWDNATDAETPSQCLSYNIRIGKSQSAADVISPEADTASGFKRVPDMGNTFGNNQFTVQNLDTGTYYWAIQTVDNGMLTSSFSAEKTFEILPVFTEEENIDLQPPTGMAVWGDYNNDGYLDILTAGDIATNTPAKIYNNNGDNTFSASGILFPAQFDIAQWSDYNNDGNLDILLCGSLGSKIYKNNGDSTFSEQTSVILPTIQDGSAHWGDYNNDGFPDILLTGWNGTEYISKIYKNNGDDTFTEQDNILTGVSLSATAWGDYDNDGYLDILLTGMDKNSQAVAKIYKNNGNGSFTEQTNIHLTAVYQSSVAWGDYDNDGDLDILLAGLDENAATVLNVYRNDGNNNFTLINTGIRKFFFGMLAWGDYNNDGLLDILISGKSGTLISKAYKNNGDGTFSEQQGLSIIGLTNSSLTLGDYDKDGDLDILLTGEDEDYNAYSGIYKNNTLDKNTLPDAPGNLSAEMEGLNLRFNWDRVSDPNNPESSLYYNVRIGTAQGASNVLNPMANTLNGTRRISGMGNAQTNTFKILKGVSPGQTFYWSVQAIEQNYAGSEWAVEQSYTIPEISAQFKTDTVCFGTPVTFTNTSTSFSEEIISYLWDFGDGNTSQEENPQHKYENSGTYSVSLTIKSASHQDQITKPVTVKESALADFEIVKQGELVCQFNNLTNTYEQKVTQWLWSFGDGNTSNEKNPPLYKYNAEGIYEVSLYVETENGCTNTATKTNIVCNNLNEAPGLYVRGPNVWYLACSNDSVSNYRWYRNGELIPEANDYIYVANQNLGTYYVEINNGGECWVPSKTITIPDDFNNGTVKKMEQIIADMPDKTSVLSYPNPNTGTFTLLFKSNYQGKIYIRIKNLNGQTLRQYYTDKNTEIYSEDLDFKAFGKGVYFIEIEYGGEKSNSKIVIE